MSLLLDNPVQPILKVPADTAVWQHCEPLLASLEAATRWQLYVHQLGWTALLPWFQAEFEGTPQLWPKGNPWGLWQVVEGIALTLGAESASGGALGGALGGASGGENRRIVVMLSEALDASELRVPKEWVDIAPWAGDYFVAAQIDVDAQQVALWGYATRSQIKAEGTYNSKERCYYLGETSLIQDLSAFWVAQRMPQPSTKAIAQPETEAITAMTSMQADNLLTRLAQVPEPRLEIPFSQWSALLSDGQWRRRFYQQRQGRALPNWPVGLTENLSVNVPDNVPKNLPENWPENLPTNAPVNLGNWVIPSSRQLASQLVETGWRVLDAFSPQTPAASFRSETLSPQSDMAQVGRTCGKRLTLRTASATFSLVLAISVAVESSDRRRNIRIQLYPAGPLEERASEETTSDGVFSPDAFSESVFSPDLLLPKGLTLSLHISEAIEPLRTVQTGDRDNYIQLPPFRCAADRSFVVRIQQADGVITTDFVS